MVRKAFISALAALVAVVSANVAMAEEDGRDPSFIRFGAGYFDLTDDWEAGEFHLEYISGSKWWVFNPFIGVMGTTDSALYGYAGIRLDVFLGRRFVLTPSFAPGLYHQGDGKDLGQALEFRSAIEIAYRFDDRSRLGLSVYHLSNAGLDDHNPGTEVATLHYSLPLKRLFN